jgi:hypothetical protein
MMKNKTRLIIHKLMPPGIQNEPMKRQLFHMKIKKMMKQRYKLANFKKGIHQGSNDIFIMTSQVCHDHSIYKLNVYLLS